jgi:hypothetical protein
MLCSILMQYGSVDRPLGWLQVTSTIGCGGGCDQRAAYHQTHKS